MSKFYVTPSIDVIEIEMEDSVLQTSFDPSGMLEDMTSNGGFGDWAE